MTSASVIARPSPSCPAQWPAAVARRVWLHSRQKPVAAKNLGAQAGGARALDAEHPAQIVGPRKQARFRYGVGSTRV